MTLEEFCNMAISAGYGTTFWVEELSEDNMEGAGFSAEYAEDYVNFRFRTNYKASVVLAKKYAKAKVIHFQAVGTDVLWVTILV